MKPLDVVFTKLGTIAVVLEVDRGLASLAFANSDTDEKIAWYHADELTVIRNVIDMVKP